ncbi:MAG: TIR domain-containing protein [Acidobacteria bacterium]|nr:TIR domain-containing protein [Acidobacteriota bacterium]
MSVEQIKKVVSYLFQVSCKNWYGGKRRLAKNEREPLDRLYRGYLNLLDEPHVAELKNQFGQLAQQQTLGNSSMFLLKDGHLQVQIADRQQIILPNPVLFALEEHSSKARRDFFPPPAQVAITHGDLHSGNIVVGDAERIWLIDFYKTGWGHILRDFAELESDIKFTLLQSNSLRERYDLEEALLTPKSLREPIVGLLKHPTPVQTRALETIQHLRSLACQLTDVEKVHEYHIALLFLALKRMIGFTSADSAKPSESIAQYHALLSAAMICERLQTAARKANSPSEAKKKIFLSYASEDRDKVDRLYQQLSDAGHEPWIDHKELVGGEDWNGSIKLAIENSAIFISCLSKNSVGKRGFFQREANQAVDKVQEMLPRDIFIIPVMLEECDLPERLAKYHAIQLYQEDGWPQLLKAIAESKRRRQQQ